MARAIVKLEDETGMIVTAVISAKSMKALDQLINDMANKAFKVVNVVKETKK